MVTEDFLRKPRLDGVEPAWTLLTRRDSERFRN